MISRPPSGSIILEVMKSIQSNSALPPNVSSGNMPSDIAEGMPSRKQTSDRIQTERLRLQFQRSIA
ncbi:hypothetical protein D3C73_1319280 [compost metagenome]